MDKPFIVKIIHPFGIKFEGEAISVTIPTNLGPLCAEKGYTNCISTISKSGVLKLVTKEGNRFFAVFGGVAEIRLNDGAYIYTEEINEGYEIDMARAIASRDRNLDRIQHHGEGADVERAKIKLSKALTRINVKELSEGKRG